MSASDFGTLIGYPVTLFNRLIQWWGQITIGGFTLWQWILSFFLVGIAISVFRILLGGVPSVGVASADTVRRAEHRIEYEKQESKKGPIGFV